MADKNNSTPVRLKSLSEKFNVMDLLDPRSPTTAFQRTPIQVILKNSRTISSEECPDKMSSKIASESSASFISLSSPPKMEDESLELSASSASFLSLDNLTDMDSVNLSAEDLSILVSDLSFSSEETEQEFPCVVKEIEEELPYELNDEVDRSIDEDYIEPQIVIEKEEATVTPDCSVTPVKFNPAMKATIANDSFQDDSSNDSFLENAVRNRKKPLKNVFYTPNPNKKRNPLGAVDNTCPTTPPSHLSYGSPQNVLCEKQWKRIQVERKKLGLEADENTQLPLYDITASAPSKLIRKSRLQARHNGVMS